MGTQIEPVERAQESKEAWKLYIEGVSKTEIARRLGRNFRTINSYLAEAAEWTDTGTLEVRRAAIIAGHRDIIRRSTEMLESGEIKPTSLAGPQYLMQIREALKEWARLEGLYVERKDVNVNHVPTAADLIRQYEEARASGMLVDEETIVDGELIENEDS